MFNDIQRVGFAGLGAMARNESTASSVTSRNGNAPRAACCANAGATGASAKPTTSAPPA